MSEALTPDAPEASDAAPAVADSAPSDGTAVESGSAGSAEAKTVDAGRFNGLMSAHQKTLAELAARDAEVAALQARLATQQQEETHDVADDQLAEELRELRSELAAERLERVKAEALAEYPAAAPLADLIVGSTAEEIRSVAAAIATRLQGMAPVSEGGDPPPAEPEVPASEPTVPPVAAGGAEAPPAVDTTAARKEALQSQDWNAYWNSFGDADTSTLA